MTAVRRDDSFYIALPYAERTDWLKNVLASGKATLLIDGESYDVDEPEVIPIAQATHYFGGTEQRLHRLFAVESALRLHQV